MDPNDANDIDADSADVPQPGVNSDHALAPGPAESDSPQLLSTDKNQQEKAPVESYVLVRWIYLRLLGVIHLMAFASYAVMIIGLNGSHGILPTQDMLRVVDERFGAEHFWIFPTITWFNCSDAFLQGITYAGIALSLFVILGIATAPALLVLGVLWLSLVTGGGEFTGFQSDGMLVEATFLTLFFAPWQLFEPPWPVPLRLRRQRPPAKSALWLLRCMIFRLMFASGLLKILSGDPTWADLTALQYHFETQPIPTPLAWYAHHLPAWMLKTMVAGTFVSELVAPLLVFAPRIPRIVGADLMFLLHVWIALTGNYTFLNFLAMVLCVPLVDDRFLRRFIPEPITREIEASQETRPPQLIFRFALNGIVAVLIVLAAGQLLDSTGARRLVPALVNDALVWLSPLRIVDSYGVFAVMTTTRPEIVFEGSRDGKTWQSYEFLYKPGDNLRRAPPWVEPHMPRLDWRLWFAAMVPLDENPWVLAFVRRLLEGEPGMKQFFERDPFSDSPPKYIRAFVYDYHFTDPASRAATGCWWRRDNKRVYLAPVLLQDGHPVYL